MLPAYDLIGQQFTIILCPNDYYSDCDVKVPAFREIAKNYLKQVREEENQNEHSDDEETETQANEN